MADRIDFAGLAEAALAAAYRLVSSWLPEGRQDGHEWKALNPVRADRREGSFSINLNTGAWGDFATDDKGGDLVSLCAYLFHHNNQLEAAYDVAEQVDFPMPPRKKAQAGQKPERQRAPSPPAGAAGVEGEGGGERVKRKKSDWVPVMPAPESAGPAPVAHIKRGRPEASWCYRDADGRVLGHIYRFKTSDGGKEVLPVVWARHETSGVEEWRWMAFGEAGRPLYGLDRLAAKPEATVLVVEGEKCADVAAAQLPDLAVVSWPGGGKAVSKADWSLLAGRRVVIWPDCDAQLDKHTQAILPEAKQPGVKAAREIAAVALGQGCKVWLVEIPAPGEKPSGWDVADAVADGLTGAELAAWVRDRSRVFVPGDPAAPASAEGLSTPTEACAGKGGSEPHWRSRLLRTQKGELERCLANVFDCLHNAPSWEGVLAFDEFSQRTVKLRPPPYFGGKAGEWEATDDAQTAIWLTRNERFAPSSALVSETIETLARANTVHPVRAWLRALPAWDKVPRCEHWLVDYLGVADSEYVRLVAKWFLLGMIARVMKPGCKFDYCLVLEGEQGKNKSTALNALAGDDWFGDTDLDLHNKDAMIALQGKWLYELSEMGSVARAEVTRQKSFLSRRMDEYRPPYGRRDIRCPRQLVFAGSTNDWEWNKDPTGGRRFWPVMCGDIDVDALRSVREQLFAEALALYEAGERYWPTRDEQKRLFDPEQLQREQQESLIDALHDWVFSQVAEFSIAQAAMDGLKLDASKLTRDLQTRIGTALRKLGCTKVERRNGMVRYWYKPPARNGAGSTSASSAAPAQHATEGNRAPF